MAEVKFTRAAALWSALIPRLLVLVVLWCSSSRTRVRVDGVPGLALDAAARESDTARSRGGALITVMVRRRVIQLRRAAKNLRAAMKR